MEDETQWPALVSKTPEHSKPPGVEGKISWVQLAKQRPQDQTIEIQRGNQRWTTSRKPKKVSTLIDIVRRSIVKNAEEVKITPYLRKAFGTGEASFDKEKKVLLLSLLLDVPEQEISNVYIHGSRAWGNHTVSSDW